jgi:serine phosphatase RsbU (regulator of sigma subunit)
MGKSQQLTAGQERLDNNPESGGDSGFDFKSGKFKDYVDGILHEWLETVTKIAFILVPLFLILDYFTMPYELLPKFGLYRLAATVIMIIQYNIIKNSRPNRFSFLHAYFVSIVVGGVIALMTTDLGGFNSRYYAGLNLVIIGANLLLPWKATRAAINCSINIGLYLIFNIIAGKEYNPSIIVNNLFFLTATSVIVVSINHLRYKLVKKEFFLMVELQKARDAIWSEMELAKRIQTALLPEGKRIKGVEIAASMNPAREVGGDYYDIITTPDGGKWVTIGDVSGHGVDSGLIMMMAETTIISMVTSKNSTSPSKVLASVNSVIRENLSRLGSDHYITLMAIQLLDSRLIVAGKHQDMLIYRAASDKTDLIETEGTWLGITDNVTKSMKDIEVPFNEGDILMLFTDGMTEAMNRNGEMYGQVRLEQALNRYADFPVNKLLEKIMSDVEKFQEDQLDDMTLVVMKKLPV